MSVTAVYELITPDVAKAMLTCNTQNRVVRPGTVKRYVIDMQEGRWKRTHQGIAFDEGGVLLDGQHRLLAVIESGCSVHMMVTRGLPKDSHLGIDDHARRSVYDAYCIEKDSSSVERQHATLANAMFRYPADHCSAVSRQRVIDKLELHFDAINFVVENRGPIVRGLTQAAVMVCVVRAWYHYKDKERLKQFLKVLNTGLPTTEGDVAAILLRNWLLAGQQDFKSCTPRAVAYKKAQRAIQAFMNDEPINKLYAATSELFPLPEEREAGDQK